MDASAAVESLDAQLREHASPERAEGERRIVAVLLLEHDEALSNRPTSS